MVFILSLQHVLTHMITSQSSTIPRGAGLLRPVKRQLVAGGGGSAPGACNGPYNGLQPRGGGGGIVPPFVQKAISGPSGEEGPYSEKVMQLLAGVLSVIICIWLEQGQHEITFISFFVFHYPLA